MLSLQLSRKLFLSFLSFFTDSDYPSILQEAEIPIFNHQACEKLYNPIGPALPELESVIQDDEICAGDILNKKDSCKVRVCPWVCLVCFLIWNFNLDSGFLVYKQ